MFESVSGDFAANNAAALDEIRGGFVRLTQAFPSVIAPKQPAIEYQALLAIVTRIEQAAAKLT